jgi:aspartate aminotransferase/N-succinyldiaminopimelate aminotransferase
MSKEAMANVPLSVFGDIVHRLERSAAPRKIPLHQGKTAFTIPIELRSWSPAEFDFPPYHDGPPQGAPMLLERLQDSLSRRLARPIAADCIQVTNGITHGLSLVFSALLSPGDEVLILSPQWLFTKGLVAAAGGTATEVPFFTDAASTSADLGQLLNGWIGPNTRAIYFNSPNNPTGRALSRPQVESLVDLARRRSLWLVSDNAYEHYDYTTDGFTDPARAGLGEDVTFSAYSFSKSFGLTGYRIGYLVSPPALALLIQKLALHSVYSSPTICQFAAMQAMASYDQHILRNRAFVRRSLDILRSGLSIPCTEAEGGFYTLLDLADYPGGSQRFMDEGLQRGVSLAPGSAFGSGCGDRARLCFTVVGSDRLEEGIAILNSVYQRG